LGKKEPIEILHIDTNHGSNRKIQYLRQEQYFVVVLFIPPISAIVTSGLSTISTMRQQRKFGREQLS
jgi:hypothetical protein